MRDGFGAYHPIVNIVFFVAVLGTAAFAMHPIVSLIEFICAISYYAYIKRRTGIRTVIMLIPVLFLTAIINPLFNHRGITPLFYLPTGNQVTLEAVLYGLAAGLMLVAIIAWFLSFNIVMDIEKILCITNKTFPTIGMIMMMVLRFIPKYNKQTKKVIASNKALSNENFEGMGKIKQGLKVFGIMSTWALETSVITADSMKARGFGTTRRTVYSKYKFNVNDTIMLMVILALLVCNSLLIWNGNIDVNFYPRFKIDIHNIGGLLVYLPIMILNFLPLILSIKEDMIWHRLKSKI